MKKEEIIKIVKNNLPEFSGKEKVFLIIFKLGINTVKVVFWRPEGHTLVAHNYKVPEVDGCDVFKITSFHDSTWEYDGLFFFNMFSEEENRELTILSSEILEGRDCMIDDDERFFIIKK